MADPFAVASSYSSLVQPLAEFAVLLKAVRAKYQNELERSHTSSKRSDYAKLARSMLAVLDKVEPVLNAFKQYLNNFALVDVEDVTPVVVSELRICSINIRRLNARSTDLAKQKVKLYYYKDRNLANSVDTLKRLVEVLNDVVERLHGRSTLPNITKHSLFLGEEQDRQILMNWLDWYSLTEMLDWIQQARLDSPFVKRFLGTEDFHNWKHTASSLFLSTGLPGSGKTVLWSSVVRYLRETKKHKVMWFSFGTGVAEPTTASLLRSMLAQFVEQYPGSFSIKGSIEILSWITRHITSATMNSVDLLQMFVVLLKRALGKSRQASQGYVIIDEMDNCLDPEGLLSVIRVLRLELGSRLMVFGRRPTLRSTATHYINISEHRESKIQEDIRYYLEDPKLFQGLPQSFKDSIMQPLQERADGSFLWVSLFMERLSNSKTEAEALHTITSTQRGLESLYDAIYKTIAEGHNATTKRALAWLLFSVRPMRQDELAEACIANPNPDDIDFKERLFDPRVILRDCSPFTTLIPTTSETQGLYKMPRTNTVYTVTLAHSSLKEFLQRNWSLDYTDAFHSLSAQEYIAEVCLAYLLRVAQEGLSLDQATNDYPFLDYAIENWEYHVMQCDVPKLDFLLKTFFTDRRVFDLLLAPADLDDTSPQNSIAAQSKSNNTAGPAPFLKFAARIGLIPIVHFLLSNDAPPGLVWVDEKSRAQVLGESLMEAVIHCRSKIVETLLGSGADSRFATESHNSPIEAAAAEGHVQMIEPLVSQMKKCSLSASCNEQDSDDKDCKNADMATYGRALHKAVLTGHKNIIKVLYNVAGVDINFRDPTSGLTALHLAVQRDDMAIYNELLHLGANWDVASNEGLSPLDLAWSKTKIDHEAYEFDPVRSERLDTAGQAECSVLRRKDEVEQSGNTKHKFIFCKTFKLEYRNKFEKNSITLVRKHLLREHKILQQLQHPFLIEYLGFYENEEKTYAKLFIEYCNGQSLHQYVKEEVSGEAPTESLTEAEAWLLVFQLAAALAYLHHGLIISPKLSAFQYFWERILHRDIKPENVVYHCPINDEDKKEGEAEDEERGAKKVAKLCDLGLAKRAQALTQYLGTPDYKPPEMYRARKPQKEWTIKGEIYSLGLTLENLEKSFDPSPEGLQLLIDKCLEDNPLLRPSSLELLQESTPHVRDTFGGFSSSIESLLTVYTPNNYLLNAVLVLGNRLDEQDSWRLKSTRRTRRKMLKRLRVLIVQDGAGKAFDDACTLAISSPSSFAQPFYPLHLAVVLGRVDKVAEILQATQTQEQASPAKLDINEKWEKSGWTALHLAFQVQAPLLVGSELTGNVRTQAEELIQQYQEAGKKMEKLLLDAGADGEIMDRHSLVPKDCNVAVKEDEEGDTETVDPGWRD